MRGTVRGADVTGGDGLQPFSDGWHPHFAKRFIRTFKDMLFKRVDADEKKGKVNILD